MTCARARGEILCPGHECVYEGPGIALDFKRRARFSISEFSANAVHNRHRKVAIRLDNFGLRRCQDWDEMFCAAGFDRIVRASLPVDRFDIGRGSHISTGAVGRDSMLKTVWNISILAVLAMPAAANDADVGAKEMRIMHDTGAPIVVAQAPRRIDSNAILRSLAPIDYLPEHSGKKRTIDLDIRFQINSAKLSRSAIGQLDELAAAIRAPRLTAVRFRVAGHTDASGAAPYNKALSARRAAAVKSYLVKRHGIRPARLETVGWGEERLKNPIIPEGADNRRVEVIALSMRQSEKSPRSRTKKVDW